MEENKHSEKKKTIITLTIGILIMLVLVISSTYAYFQVNTANNNTSSNITAKAGKIGLATLKQGISNLHIKLTNNDMSLNNANKEYYVDDEENYVDNNVDGTHVISSIQITDGDTDTNYKCSADVVITLNTAEGSMGSVIEKGDIILKIESEEIDLYDIKTNNPKTINVAFNMYGNDTKNIGIYAKLINKETSQIYLAGKTLNVDIKTQNIKCNVIVDDKKVAQLRSKDTQGYLSPTIQGGMYRYQAAFEDSDSSEMTNWICFGTTENCGANDELIDKYMYRIIGITPDGEMKLIKETFIKEESTSGFAWNDKYSVDPEALTYCPNGKCPDWPDSELFKRLNGTSNGKIEGIGSCYPTCDNADTDIFVDSEQYDYLQSGDNTNGSTWYNLISEHEWMYGDTPDASNGDAMYQIETGQKETSHYVQQPAGSTTVVSESYKWPSTNKVKSKISLMYIHDYVYAYPGGNPGNATNRKNSWIHFQKDGYNTSSTYEWLSTRWGMNSVGGVNVHARITIDIGSIGNYALYSGNGVRPVFYLSSEAKIKDGGDGTKTNPYILDVNE